MFSGMRKLLRLLYFGIYVFSIRDFPSKNVASAFGCRLRLLWVGPFFREIGKNVNIQPGVEMHPLYNISIGDNSGVGRDSYISAADQVMIGKDVMIGPQLMLYTANHETKLGVPMIMQPMIKKPVTIEDDVWIGSRVTILPGVTIGKGSVIAAGSVVTRNVEPFSIYGGVPAKLIKKRT